MALAPHRERTQQVRRDHTPAQQQLAALALVPARAVQLKRARLKRLQHLSIQPALRGTSRPTVRATGQTGRAQGALLCGEVHGLISLARLLIQAMLRRACLVCAQRRVVQAPVVQIVFGGVRIPACEPDRMMCVTVHDVLIWHHSQETAHQCATGKFTVTSIQCRCAS